MRSQSNFQPSQTKVLLPDLVDQHELRELTPGSVSWLHLRMCKLSVDATVHHPKKQHSAEQYWTCLVWIVASQNRLLRDVPPQISKRWQ